MSTLQLSAFYRGVKIAAGLDRGIFAAYSLWRGYDETGVVGD
jgi:hypothetical protein